MNVVFSHYRELMRVFSLFAWWNESHQIMIVRKCMALAISSCIILLKSKYNYSIFFGRFGKCKKYIFFFSFFFYFLIMTPEIKKKPHIRIHHTEDFTHYKPLPISLQVVTLIRKLHNHVNKPNYSSAT